MIITEEVRKILEKLKIYTPPGPDEMYPHILGETAAEIALPLSIICRKSLASKSVPVEWEKRKLQEGEKEVSK